MDVEFISQLNLLLSFLHQYIACVDLNHTSVKKKNSFFLLVLVHNSYSIVHYIIDHKKATWLGRNSVSKTSAYI